MTTRIFSLALALTLAGSGHAPAVDPPPHGTPGPEAAAHAFNLAPGELVWHRIFPEFGERSAEIVILHVDPVSGGTQLMIRVPPDSHVPKHWHTANETHTVMKGTFVMECDGHRQALAAGSFNFVPGKVAHEAWTTTAEGAVLFITVDSAWDIHWVDGPPKARDLVGGVPVPR